jgi:hypothetical protein
MVEMVEHLPSKCEALSSNPLLPKELNWETKGKSINKTKAQR